MMKYVYSSMAVIGITAGVYLLFTGRYSEAMLTMIFGAICLVAAEISELSEALEQTKK